MNRTLASNIELCASSKERPQTPVCGEWIHAPLDAAADRMQQGGRWEFEPLAGVQRSRQSRARAGSAHHLSGFREGAACIECSAATRPNSSVAERRLNRAIRDFVHLAVPLINSPCAPQEQRSRQRTLIVSSSGLSQPRWDIRAFQLRL